MKPDEVQPGDIVFNMFGGNHARIEVLSPPEVLPDGRVTFLSNHGRETYSSCTPLVPDQVARQQITESMQHYQGRELNPGERDQYRGLWSWRRKYQMKGGQGDENPCPGSP